MHGLVDGDLSDRTGGRYTLSYEQRLRIKVRDVVCCRIVSSNEIERLILQIYLPQTAHYLSLSPLPLITSLSLFLSLSLLLSLSLSLSVSLSLSLSLSLCLSLSHSLSLSLSHSLALSLLWFLTLFLSLSLSFSLSLYLSLSLPLSPSPTLHNFLCVRQLLHPTCSVPFLRSTTLPLSFFNTLFFSTSLFNSILFYRDHKRL